jgi:uncharacterized membrane protein
MGLLAPPASAGSMARVRGIAIVVGLVVLLLAIGFGLANLVALPFGGVGILGGILLGLVIVVAVFGVLALVGRRRQAKAQATRAARSR